MHITFNGQNLELPTGISLLETLEQQNLDPNKVVAERNACIIPAEKFSSTILEAEDIIEVLHFVGGG